MKNQPYIRNNTLFIPFNSDKKYWWWDNGQLIHDTLIELNAHDDLLSNYCDLTNDSCKSNIDIDKLSPKEELGF